MKIGILHYLIVGKDAPARSTAVLEFKKMGYDSWKQMHQYGRWSIKDTMKLLK